MFVHSLCPGSLRRCLRPCPCAFLWPSALACLFQLSRFKLACSHSHTIQTCSPEGRRDMILDPIVRRRSSTEPPDCRRWITDTCTCAVRCSSFSLFFRSISWYEHARVASICRSTCTHAHFSFPHGHRWSRKVAARTTTLLLSALYAITPSTPFVPHLARPCTLSLKHRQCSETFPSSSCRRP